MDNKRGALLKVNFHMTLGSFQAQSIQCSSVGKGYGKERGRKFWAAEDTEGMTVMPMLLCRHDGKRGRSWVGGPAAAVSSMGM